VQQKIRGIEVVRIDAEDIEMEEQKISRGCRWYSRARRFGVRGIEVKSRRQNTAREKGIPYFGLCLGMQIAVVDLLVNVPVLKMLIALIR